MFTVNDPVFFLVTDWQYFFLSVPFLSYELQLNVFAYIK